MASASTSGPVHSSSVSFPPTLESYEDGDIKSIGAILANRIEKEPFNLVATLIFLSAITHTFLTTQFLTLARKRKAAHEKKIAEGKAYPNSVDVMAGVFEFLGEVEAVFGIWAVALGFAIAFFRNWHSVVGYISHDVNFTEPMFVVTIMTLASTRPILKLAEKIMWVFANLIGGTLAAWWFTILTLGPMLGSLITEPAAMTISALLLAHKLYDLEPSTKFKYATIGLLFVNVSIGGTLTHFAAPPVLMIAGPWGWGLGHMLAHFGWKVCLAILVSNGIYFIAFRKELKGLQGRYALKNLKDEIQHRYLVHQDLEAEIENIAGSLDREGFLSSLREQFDQKAADIKDALGKLLAERYAEELRQRGIDIALAQKAFEQRVEEIKLLRLRRNFAGLLPKKERPPFRDPLWDTRDDPVPMWVTVVHVGFMAWTVINAHHAPFFVAGLLFFLGFAKVTGPYQNRVDLRPPLLVGFFLAGLVIHGGLQGWWIEPVLGNLNELPLMLAATGLTAFNDNAAITYLSTLVPEFTDGLKYSVVAGAISGGGLTVIANAPNPAGQSLLKKYFDSGVSPGGLLKGALLPTIVAGSFLLVFK